MFVGGFNGDLKLTDVMKTPFEGCIDEFQVNSLGIDLNRNYNARGIVPGCPEVVSY